MKESNLFSRNDIDRLALRSIFLQVCFNYERMQGVGWAYTLMPYLKRIYKDEPQKLSEAMKDHMGFINTHPNLVGFLFGLILSLEEKKRTAILSAICVSLFSGRWQGSATQCFGSRSCRLSRAFALLSLRRAVF